MNEMSERQEPKIHQTNLSLKATITQNGPIRCLILENKDGDIGINEEQLVSRLLEWSALQWSKLKKHENYIPPKLSPNIECYLTSNKNGSFYNLVTVLEGENSVYDDGLFILAVHNYAYALAKNLGLKIEVLND